MSDDSTTMDATTMDIRKFLKKVGISSQQEIEKALEQMRASGKLQGLNSITATMRLEVPDLDLEHTIESEISLS
ncbi:DUF6494 family protein [Kaarinaea lacus]